MPEFTAIRQPKPYQAIVEQVLNGINAGDLNPGSALPAARTLATQFGVPLGTVREALRVLEHAQVVEVRAGSGSYVTEAAQTKAAMIHAQAAAAGDHSPLDLVAARQLLEPGAARLAAEHHDSEDLAVLRRHLDEQRRLTLGGSDPADPDWRFHLSVANASRNSVVASLMEVIAQSMHERSWKELKARSRELEGSGNLFLDEHEAVFAAIEQRDGPGAERAMQHHICSIEGRLIRAYESRLLEVPGHGDGSKEDGA